MLTPSMSILHALAGRSRDHLADLDRAHAQLPAVRQSLDPHARVELRLLGDVDVDLRDGS